MHAVYKCLVLLWHFSLTALIIFPLNNSETSFVFWVKTNKKNRLLVSRKHLHLLTTFIYLLDSFALDFFFALPKLLYCWHHFLSLVRWIGYLHSHRSQTTPGLTWTIACVFRQTGDHLTFQPWPNERTIVGNTVVCSNGNKQACFI